MKKFLLFEKFDKSKPLQSTLRFELLRSDCILYIAQNKFLKFVYLATLKIKITGILNYRNWKFNSFSFLPSVLFSTFCTKQMTIHLTVKLNICDHFILRKSTYNILVSLLLHVGRELYKPKLMGCDGTSFPGRGWLSLDHVTAWNRCRWFSGIRRLRKRFDILWRSWLQTRLPELLKTGHLLFSLCNAEQIYQASRHSSTTTVTVSICIYLCFLIT